MLCGCMRREVENDDRTSFGTRVLSSHGALNHTC